MSGTGHGATRDRAARTHRVPVDGLLDKVNTAVDQIEGEDLTAGNLPPDVPPHIEPMWEYGSDRPSRWSRGDTMANKDKGGRSTKKAASRSLKEKRQAKKAKKA
jgi:hypothetical protein